MVRKQIVTLLATAAFAAYTYGQGTVNFNTQNLGTSARVTDAVEYGSELLGSAFNGDGTNFFAQLYAAAGTGVASSSLSAVGVAINFRAGANAGYVITSGTTSMGVALTPSPPGPGSVVTINSLAAGGPATIQMRAWWGAGNQITTYESAAAQLGTGVIRIGNSDPFNLLATGDPTASPATQPVALTGLVGFQLYVPEPSTMALAGLGAAALLLFRRRK